MPLDWAVQQLRTTLFSSAPVSASERDWQAITGQQEAESRTTIPGGKRFSGKFAGGRLSLAYAAQRLDMILQAGDAAAQPDAKLHVVGPWNGLVDDFVKVAEVWLTHLQIPVVRIAFGAALLVEADTPEDAHQKLAGLLRSVAVDARAMRDLLFRVNWPRKSKAVPDLTINRITTWSSVRVMSKLVEVSGAGIAVGAGTEIQAVRLEIDHNTDATNLKPLDRASLQPVLKELVIMARENADLGEQP